MSKVIARVLCNEPGNSIVRSVTFAPLTPEFITELWEKLSKFPTLFNRHIATVEDFISSFITRDGNGLTANGLIWTVDDVGIVFLSNIYPAYQATAHITFWDRRFRGREELLRELLRYAFREFGFQRIITEIPFYSQPTFKAAERVGFVKEGRMRKAAFYKDEWWDVNLYSVLAEEMIEDGDIQATD